MSEIKFEFKGTGGKLFGRLFVGFLLTAVTCGLYYPWFLCALLKDIFEDTRLLRGGRGPLQLEFRGNGAELFGTLVGGYLLTLCTLGIYLPWFIANLVRFEVENTKAKDPRGVTFGMKFKGSGGEFLAAILVGYLLTLCTLGIYLPWFIVNLHKLILSNIELEESEQTIGGLDFHGQGGELFGTFIVGYLLTICTLGIYGPWFQVNLFKFQAAGLRASLAGGTYSGEFTGEGGEYFGIFVVGYLLTVCTLGIYSFWWMANMLRFQLDHLTFQEVGEAAA